MEKVKLKAGCEIEMATDQSIYLQIKISFPDGSTYIKTYNRVALEQRGMKNDEMAFVMTCATEAYEKARSNRAWDEGQRAAINGETLNDNPYQDSDERELAETWREGYFDMSER